jgi:CHASE3 domain sensor protein
VRLSKRQGAGGTDKNMIDQGSEPLTELETQAIQEIKREWRAAKRENRINVAVTILIAVLLVAGVAVVVVWALWPR